MLLKVVYLSEKPREQRLSRKQIEDAKALELITYLKKKDKKRAAELLRQKLTAEEYTWYLENKELFDKS